MQGVLHVALIVRIENSKKLTIRQCKPTNAEMNIAMRN